MVYTETVVIEGLVLGEFLGIGLLVLAWDGVRVQTPESPGGIGLLLFLAVPLR